MSILSVNKKFHAIFATSSIPEAIEYYGLFKDKMPSLKVTCLFDPHISNEDGEYKNTYKGKPVALFKEDGLVRSLTITMICLDKILLYLLTQVSKKTCL